MISLILMTFIFYHMFYQTVKLNNFFLGKELTFFVKKHGLDLEWCGGGVEGVREQLTALWTAELKASRLWLVQAARSHSHHRLYTSLDLQLGDNNSYLLGNNINIKAQTVFRWQFIVMMAF